MHKLLLLLELIFILDKVSIVTLAKLICNGKLASENDHN